MAEEKKPAKIRLPEYFKEGYVLVADDMTNMRRTLKNMLKQIGASAVLEADDGTTALETLRDNAGCKFALIDWNMPRMTGIAAAKEIRADAKIQDTPILLITAEVEEHQVVQAAEVGVNGYILKPFVLKTLEDKIRAIIEARERPPAHVIALKKGEELIKQGKFQEALDVFEEAKKLKENARIHVEIGSTMELLGQFDKAHGSYAEASKINPKFLKAHLKNAELHLKRGNEDGALESLTKANEISPGNPDRHIAIGKIHLNKGNTVKMQEAFSEAIKHAPHMSSEIAEEMLKLGQAALAEQFFRQSIAKQSDAIYTYNRLGIALRRQGKWKEAIHEYEIAIKLDPNDANLYFNVAKSYLEGEDRDLAVKYFKRALSLNPELTAAKNELELLNR
ncbi:MAG: tetratricopeptide repeat protein [Nitrospinae bacterium]|nr:tetratricopeptide repeat protein [Nitrospinota bacterium]